MSPELTFRQKLIRIGSSAAICGLSVSFILGEAVDSHAKELGAWVTDPSLLPAAYLPIRPVLSALDNVETSQWKQNLVASNDLPATPQPQIRMEPNRLAPPVRLAQLSPAEPKVRNTIYMEPAIVSVAAAPNPKPPAKSEVAIEKVLDSIHQAQASLGTQKVAVNTPTVVQITPPASTTKGSEEAAPAAAPGLVASALKPWSIQGKIWGSTDVSLGAGHFEVGLYSKVDPDQKPVGYPLTQQILPAGQTSFKLDVPARIERGYLFAEFVPAKNGKPSLVAPQINPWERTTRRLADLYFHAQDTISTVAAAVAPVRDLAHEQWRVQGKVTTMFASSAIAQGDAVIKVRGRKESTRTDAKGNFSLDLPRMKGTLFLEVLKAGYHPTILNVSAGDETPLRVELASRHAIEQIAERLGSTQGANAGVFIGRATSADGTLLRGMTAQLSIKADGPFYFDEEGNVTRELKSTSGSGRFIFLNVEAGTGYLETSLNGEAIAPIQISSVEGGELLQKTLVPVSGSLRGRIFNPVAVGGKMQPLTSARVRVDGASEWVNSDAFGAFSIGPLKWIKGERISLEMSAEKFNNHRYLVSADGEGGPLNLFAFPATYISRLARSMDVDVDPYAGVVIGKVTGPSLRIDALADQSLVNNARDFYFDSKGRLRGSHEMTDPRFGTYIIFNVPKGRALLQGNDSAGTLRYSGAVFASSSSINVEMEF